MRNELILAKNIKYLYFQQKFGTSNLPSYSLDLSLSNELTMNIAYHDASYIKNGEE